jgi:hypothetical protein
LETHTGEFRDQAVDRRSNAHSKLPKVSVRPAGIHTLAGIHALAGPWGIKYEGRYPIVGRLIVKFTHSKTKKKAYEDLCKTMLKYGQGIAIQVIAGHSEREAWNSGMK